MKFLDNKWLEIAFIPLVIVIILLIKFKLLPAITSAKVTAVYKPTSTESAQNPDTGFNFATDWPGESTSQDGQTTQVAISPAAKDLYLTEWQMT